MGWDAQSPGGPSRRRKPSIAERRERRAAVDDVGEVLDAAARFLEARPRSIAEVRRRLTGAGYRPDLVEAAIARMTELGYLDDAGFARAWVESRDRAHPRGEHALRQELRLKGIDRETVDAVLGERRAARDADPEAASADERAAANLLERNARALDRVADPRRRRQRAYALLARHGFDPSVASAALRRMDEPADPDAPADGE